MLYIIGGPPRSGKSAVRKGLLERHFIPGISLDVIVEMLHKAMPELGINSSIDRKILNLRLWPFLEGLIYTKAKSDDDFVIEGEYFTPDKISIFKDDPRIKVCFMVYPYIPLEEKLKFLRQYAKPKDWFNSLGDTELLSSIEKWHVLSHEYKGECEARKIKFFDTSFDFEKVIEEAVEWIVAE